MKIRAKRRVKDVGASKFTAAKSMSKEEKDRAIRGDMQRAAKDGERAMSSRPSKEDEEKLRTRRKGRVSYNMLHSPHVSRLVGRMVEVILATDEPLVLETDEGTVIVTIEPSTQPSATQKE